MCRNGDGKHKISLKNLENNEEIPHSVLFVNGEIGEKCSQNSLSVILNSEYRESCPVSQINSEFKCLLSLKDGVNELTLNYCDISLSITLNHAKSDNLRTVTPLYIVTKNHDGTFQARGRNSAENACERITLGIRIVQMVFAEKLRASGASGRKTFRLSGDCQQFLSDLSTEEASRMTERQLWSFFARELIERMPVCECRKFVAFIGCTRYHGTKNADYSYESIRAATVANAALASGGLALLGSGTLFSWPECVEDVRNRLEDETKVPLDELMDDSGYRRTFGGCFATSLGSLLHEMGHIFDLAHCEEGIMGSNCDRIDQMLTLRDFYGRWGALPRRRVPTGRERGAKCTVVRRPDGIGAFNGLSSGVYFAENCLILLDSHKWFNGSVGQQLDTVLAFNADTREISGKYPLRLVEMRNVSGLVERYWSISKSEDMKVYYFTIPAHLQLMKCTIFCIDVFGNTLAQSFK